MNPFDQLTSDMVPGMLLSLGLPACAFLLAFSTTTWRKAVRYQTRVRTLAYLLSACAGVVVTLLGAIVAAELSFVVAMNENPAERALDVVLGPAYSPDYEAFVLTIILWPLGWCLLIGVVRWVAGDRLSRAIRSMCTALIAGFLLSVLVLPLVYVIGSVTDSSCCPVDPTAERFGGPVRVVAFLDICAITMSVLAWHQTRHHVAVRQRRS
jgi:glucan phosphoethanolaminetransferase (alkaline phosphatase superfamily)